MASQHPTWRATPVPRAPAPPPAGWRYPDSPAAPRRLRWGWLLLAFAALLGMTTLLIWLLLWLAPPGPAALLVVHAGYEENLHIPHNAPGRHAAERLADLARTSEPLSSLFNRSGRMRLAAEPVQLLRGADWARSLDRAREKTVIIYLAAHGGSDGEGAYLLPHDANAEKEDRLRLEKILDRLADLPASKHKLLFLDATSLQANWSLGLMHNDFARALDELQDRIQRVPNLVVIASTHADQRSWPAADGRVSLFARHVERGLAGAADTDRNGRLDAAELFAYVRDRVEDDAQRIYGAIQTPVMYPSSKDRAQALPLTFRLTPLEDEAPGDPLPAIQQAWQPYLAMQAKHSAALACDPVAWRLWQAWLVRHEQLRLCGSPLSPMALERCNQAHDRVRAALDLGLVSTRSSLALPVISGEPAVEVPADHAPTLSLWQAAPDDRRGEWEKMLKQASDPHALRRAVQTALIQMAATNPDLNLKPAAELMQLVDDPTQPTRAVEPHFLVMLARDLATVPPPPDLSERVRNALRDRLSAERHALAATANRYAYAERIHGRITPAISRADEARQQGEDLLFASSAEPWKQSDTFRASASESYTQTGTLTDALGKAFAARDRALAELPEHAAWIAGCRSGPGDEVSTRAASLFPLVRRIEQKLAEPGNGENGGELVKLAEQVNAGLVRLRVDLESFARSCESTKSVPASDAATVLPVPFLSSNTRERLARQVAQRAKLAQARLNEAVEMVSTESEANQVRRSAARQARLALAALSPAWPDRADEGRDSRDVVETAVSRYEKSGDPSELQRIGDQLGMRFRDHSGEAERLVEQARTAEQPRLSLLERADRVARRFDAGQCQATVTDASLRYRKACVQSLLAWQAERVRREQWHGEREGAPYYAVVAGQLLADAVSIDPFGRPPASLVAASNQLKERTVVEPGATTQRHLVAGDRLAIENGLDVKGVVLGQPVMWVSVASDSGLSLASGDAQRLPMRLDSTKLPARRTVRVHSPVIDRAEVNPPAVNVPMKSTLTWHSYWRGRHASKATPIDLHPVAEATRTWQPRPASSGVALRAAPDLVDRRGDARGSLAIVLDCSGSMGPGAGKQMTDATRWRQVTRALRTMLAGVPRGTVVSIWTFGQASSPRKTATNPEETIQQLQSPLAWTGQTQQVAGVMEQLEALEPWNESPIVRTMIKAKDDLTAAEGFRTMVVLSDGADNRVAKDKSINPDGDPAAELIRKQFAGTGISIHVVGFQLASAEEQAYKAQFEVVAKLPSKGSVTTVDKVSELTRVLSRVWLPDLRWRLATERQQGPLREVSRRGQDDRWATTAPGDYRVAVTSSVPFTQRVGLGGGDRLLLRLFTSGRDWGCERLLYSEEERFARRPTVESKDWRLAVLQNQLDESAMQMLVSIERRPRAGESVIRQVHPGDVWLEMRGRKSGDGTAAMNWSEVRGYPAPCVGIDVPAWPMTDGFPSEPRLDVWWAPDRAPGIELKRGKQWKKIRDVVNMHDVAGTEATIDEMSVEERTVLIRPGVREKRWCVVVRATHAPGQPIWARLDGMPPLAGREHRFYDAGRYVGVFWYANLDTKELLEQAADEELTAVELVAVSAMKKEAESRAYRANFGDLEAPAAVPGRPTPDR